MTDADLSAIVAYLHRPKEYVLGGCGTSPVKSAVFARDHSVFTDYSSGCAG
jgi:hypothetical protein